MDHTSAENQLQILCPPTMESQKPLQYNYNNKKGKGLDLSEWQGVGWNKMIFKVLSSPNHPWILRFFKLNHAPKDGQPGQHRLSSLLR